MKLTELLSRLTGAFLRPALPVLLMLALAMAALAQETDEDTAFVQEYQHAVQLMSQGETLAAIELAEAGREKTKDLEDNCFFYIAWTGLLANLYDLEDRIDEARTLHKEAIGLCPECFEEDGMMACMPYSMAYGQMLSRQQEFVEAERVLIDMRKRLTSNDDVTPVIRAILDSDLANVEVSLGKYAEAVALLEPAAEIIRAALDGSEPDAYPKLLSNLGVALQNTGRLYEAEKVLTKSLERRRKVLGPEHHDYALTLMNLAMVKSDLGRYAEARSMFQEADQVFTNTLQYGPAHLKCIQNLAGVYMQQGEYAIAQERLEFLRANLAEAFGTATLDYAQVTNNLATLYSEVGRLSDAERLYREALRIVESVVGRNHPAYAAYLSNLAAFYQDLDRDEAALPLLQEAESVLETALGKDHPQYVKVLNDMGVSYIAMRRYDDARESLETVLKAQERIFGKDSSEDILPLSNLAEVYEAQGKLERALELEEHALKLAEEVHGRNHPDYVRRLSDTSAMMRTVGRKKDAAELLHEALHLSEAMPGNPQLRLTLLMNRMMCACEDGEIDVAERMAESWIAATRDYVGESMWGWSEESRKAFFEELDDSQVLLALLLNDRIPEEKRAALGLDASLLFKGLLLQIMAAERAVDQGLEDGAGRELARQLADLRQERAVLQNVALKRDEETRQGRLHEIARDIERCEGELAAMGEGSRDRSALLSADSRSLQKALPEDTVFIDFQEVRSIDWAGKRYTGTQLAAIVLNSGAKSCSLVMLGERQEVFAAVQAWHNMLRDQIAGVKAGSRSLGVKDEEALAALGRRVYDLLLAPLASRGLIPAGSNLIIAPCSFLYSLPFEALPFPDSSEGGLSYLIQRHAVCYVNSGRDLLNWTASQPGTAAAAVAFGDPQFTLEGEDSVAWLAQLESAAPAPQSVHGADIAPAKSLIREVTTAGDGACADGVAWGRLPAFRHHILDLHHDIEESGLPVAPPALGLAACEAAVRGLRGPRILLFATHGYYCSPSPTAATGAVPALSGGDRGHAASGAHPLLRSGLILAGGNSLPPLLRKPDLPFAELARIAANDGNLTALEVSSLDLQGTDLVSLVACETGLGDIEAGVGVAGLRSAFQIAGARSVQMSLFEVPVMLMDEADRAALAAAGTPVADAITFNSAFYRNWLAAGDRPMKKLNAHHQAQLEVLRAARANPIATLASGHPFWWGAYVLIGDPN